MDQLVDVVSTGGLRVESGVFSAGNRSTASLAAV